MENRKKDEYENLKRLCDAEGNLNYCLHVFGDQIATREGFKAHQGIEAVHFYLVHKFGWLPGVVRAMSPEDLRFVLAEEMHGFVLPKDAR